MGKPEGGETKQNNKHNTLKPTINGGGGKEKRVPLAVSWRFLTKKRQWGNGVIPIACFVLFLSRRLAHLNIFPYCVFCFLSPPRRLTLFLIFFHYSMFCFVSHPQPCPLIFPHYSVFCFASPPSGLPLNISHYSMFCFVWASPWKIWKWGRLRGRNKTH